uniref:Uncharacterized protein n=1 Tax=Triticum urartu TaxID=4572 RepID=A0A8R7QMD5_TRIUA
MTFLSAIPSNTLRPSSTRPHLEYMSSSALPALMSEMTLLLMTWQCTCSPSSGDDKSEHAPSTLTHVDTVGRNLARCIALNTSSELSAVSSILLYPSTIALYTTTSFSSIPSNMASASLYRPWFMQPTISAVEHTMPGFGTMPYTRRA